MLQKDFLLHKRYVIQSVLGKGGMGAVYLATDQILGKRVAVKENLYSTQEYNKQFKVEAQIMANVSHKNLPKVYDYFEIKDQGQYIVMDYIDGEDMRDRLDRKGKINNEEAIVIAVAICDALGYLHELLPPIIHRDIKPGNIKVDETGNIYLVDFGLAKLLLDSQLTATGARAMTPGYSPPEQYGTARTDARSDIYSLGATLYASLTGIIPEDGLARAMEQTDLTPIRSRNRKVSRSLAKIIEKSLSIHPDDRYQNVKELKKALLQASRKTRVLKRTEELTVEPPPSKGNNRFTNNDLLHNNSLSRPEIEMSGSSRARKKSMAKKGRQKKFTSTVRLFLITLMIIYLAYGSISYDWKLNKLASFYENNLISLVVTATSTNTPVPTTTFTPIPTMTQILMIAEILTEISTSTSLPTSILTITSSPTLTATATFTPTATPSSTSTPTKTSTSTETSTPTKTSTPTLTPTPLPTPLGGSSDFIYVSNSSGTYQIWLSTVTNPQKSIQLTNLENGACQPEWSPDGTQIAYISPCLKIANIFYQDATIYIMNLETKKVSSPIPDMGVFSPKWSPNGNSLLYSKVENEYIIDLYQYNFQTNTILKTVENQHINLNPNWHPDGTHFIYASNLVDAYRLMIQEKNFFADSIEISKELGVQHNYPIFTNDGLNIIFASKANESYPRIKQISVETSEALQKHGEYLNEIMIPQTHPSLSSDGNWILFTTWDIGNYNINLMHSNGEGIQKILKSEDYEGFPVWKP